MHIFVWNETDYSPGLNIITTTPPHIFFFTSQDHATLSSVGERHSNLLIFSSGLLTAWIQTLLICMVNFYCVSHCIHGLLLTGAGNLLAFTSNYHGSVHVMLLEGTNSNLKELKCVRARCGVERGKQITYICTCQDYGNNACYRSLIVCTEYGSVTHSNAHRLCYKR